MNRFAVITGGSAGIGFEMAKLLAADRFDLLICGSSDQVFEAQRQLRDFGVHVDAVKSDLCTQEGVGSVLRAISTAKRPVDVAIFNAGIATGGASFTELPLHRLPCKSRHAR